MQDGTDDFGTPRDGGSGGGGGNGGGGTAAGYLLATHPAPQPSEGGGLIMEQPLVPGVK